jgi:hypothetical protein
MSSPEDWIYLAGFFDGEGSCGIMRETRRKVNYYPFLGVCNTDKAIVEWFSSKIKEVCDGYVQFKETKDIDRRPLGKPVYRVQIRKSEAVKRVLEKLLPHLRVKKHIACLLIEYIDLKARRHEDRSQLGAARRHERMELSHEEKVLIEKIRNSNRRRECAKEGEAVGKPECDQHEDE